MASPLDDIPLPESPCQRGRFSWTGFALAIVIAPVLGVIWARIAEVAEFYYAPILLFPILLGILIGLSIVGLVRFAQIGHRPTIVLAAIVAATVAGVGQHYLGYLNAYRGPKPSVGTSTATDQNLSTLVRRMTPHFGQYMQAQARRGRPIVADRVARGPIVWLTWTIDLLLVAATAVAVTVPAMCAPYCNRCGTWYRTVRGGKIDVPTAMGIGELAGVDEIDHLRSPRYRLSACQGGCGPTRCELSWEETDGSIALARAWLDPEVRNRVVAILDERKNEQHKPQGTADD